MMMMTTMMTMTMMMMMTTMMTMMTMMKWVRGGRKRASVRPRRREPRLADDDLRVQRRWRDAAIAAAVTALTVPMPKVMLRPRQTPLAAAAVLQAAFLWRIR